MWKMERRVETIIEVGFRWDGAFDDRNQPCPGPFAGSRQFRSLLPEYRARGRLLGLPEIELYLARLWGFGELSFPYRPPIIPQTMWPICR
jgi:hypothetical protein